MGERCKLNVCRKNVSKMLTCVCRVVKFILLEEYERGHDAVAGVFSEMDVATFSVMLLLSLLRKIGWMSREHGYQSPREEEGTGIIILSDV